MKSGFVSIIGRPNVGKSTLLNSIVKKRVAITSDKPQNKLGKVLNKQAYYVINDVDIVVLVVDITEKIGTGDKFVIDVLKNIDKPVLLVINKIDKLPREEILKKIDEYQKLYDFSEIVPVSARKKDNLDRLIEVLKKYLPDSIKYFDDDTVTSSSPSFIVSEFIREKVLDLTKEEVPHSVTCIIDEMYEEDNILNITASIVVDRENLKKIIIGKQGSKIKEIGIRARKDIEDYFDKKVYLELFVKVVPKWRDKEKFLNIIGYKDFLNK